MAKRGKPRKSETELLNIIADLTEERDMARKGSQERYEYGLMLSKQLENAETRIKEMLQEIRIYEHETATLRYIITDALRQKD